MTHVEVVKAAVVRACIQRSFHLLQGDGTGEGGHVRHAVVNLSVQVLLEPLRACGGKRRVSVGALVGVCALRCRGFEPGEGVIAVLVSLSERCSQRSVNLFQAGSVCDGAGESVHGRCGGVVQWWCCSVSVCVRRVVASSM